MRRAFSRDGMSFVVGELNRVVSYMIQAGQDVFENVKVRSYLESVMHDTAPHGSKRTERHVHSGWTDRRGFRLAPNQLAACDLKNGVSRWPCMRVFVRVGLIRWNYYALSRPGAAP